MQARQRSPAVTAQEKEQLRLLEAVSDLTRFKLFKLLSTYKDMCVTDLARSCDITPPAASQHLKLMEAAGLVIRTRRGQITCYHIDTQNQQVKKVIKLLIAN